MSIRALHPTGKEGNPMILGSGLLTVIVIILITLILF